MDGVVHTARVTLFSFMIRTKTSLLRCPQTGMLLDASALLTSHVN